MVLRPRVCVRSLKLEPSARLDVGGGRAGTSDMGQSLTRCANTSSLDPSRPNGWSVVGSLPRPLQRGRSAKAANRKGPKDNHQATKDALPMDRETSETNGSDNGGHELYRHNSRWGEGVARVAGPATARRAAQAPGLCRPTNRWRCPSVLIAPIPYG